jgi:hypothetical protein
MASEADASRRTGSEGHGATSLSRRARAKHYRHYAAEIRAIAEAKPPGAIRRQLLTLAGQYDVLARMVGQPRSRHAASRKRKLPRRERAAAATL